MTRTRRCLFAALLVASTASPALADVPLIVDQLASQTPVSATTVPKNGDQNPYGVAFVPQGFPPGVLSPGDILVSNFNNNAPNGGLQGTGTTVVQVTSHPHTARTFFQFEGNHPVGFTTALGILRAGFILVGNLPSADGSGTCQPAPDGTPPTNVGPGSLFVIDSRGKLVTELNNPPDPSLLLDSPWDLTLVDDGDRATAYVSNALSATVTRLKLAVTSTGVRVTDATTIASGYTIRCDPSAFIVGVTGLAYDRTSDVLYVASTGDNTIYSVANASTTSGGGTGGIVSTDSHLRGPLGLALAANGHLLSAQGDAVNGDPTQPSEIVELAKDGTFLGQFSLDPTQGAAFGLAIVPSRNNFVLAAVNDVQATLETFQVVLQ